MHQSVCCDLIRGSLIIISLNFLNLNNFVTITTGAPLLFAFSVLISVHCEFRAGYSKRLNEKPNATFQEENQGSALNSFSYIFINIYGKYCTSNWFKCSSASQRTVQERIPKKKEESKTPRNRQRRSVSDL